MHLTSGDAIILVLIKLFLCEESVFVVGILYTRETVWGVLWFSCLKRRIFPLGEMYRAHMYLFSLRIHGLDPSDLQVLILQIKLPEKWMLGWVNIMCWVAVTGIACWNVSCFFRSQGKGQVVHLLLVGSSTHSPDTCSQWIPQSSFPYSLEWN